MKFSKNVVSVLEIGSSKINVVIGSRGVNSTFNIKGTGEAPYSGFGNGEFFEPNKLKTVFAKAINSAEESSLMSVNELYVGIPAEFLRCVCQTISSSFEGKKRLNEDMVAYHYDKAYQEFEGETLISTSSIYNIIDDGKRVMDILGEKTSKITSMVSSIYAKTTFIEMLNNLFKELGINKVTYVSSSLCEATFILSEEQRTTASMVIDVGYMSSSVCIVKGNGLLTLNSFSLGGGHIMGDLAQCLKISYSQAEALKRKIVLSLSPSASDFYDISDSTQTKQVPVKMANEIALARIEMIARCINECIQVYLKESSDYLPIYLTGGGLNYMKGAKDYVSKLLGRNIEEAAPPLPDLNKPHYSSLLGVLNYALKQEEKNNIGFLAKLFKK